LSERKVRSFREIEKVENSSALKPTNSKQNENTLFSREKQKEQNRIKNQIEKLEEKITEIEEEIINLEKKFESGHSDEDLKNYTQLKNELDKIMNQWEELQLSLE
ncbi:MAG: ABC transporter ATP-binding protein, partial [Weeksellaceae bacterium]|nr:ABC transporter ATP-binding protein [Weeksellaceae bacterium]